MVKNKGGKKKELSAREYGRKYRAASNAAEDAFKRLFEQMFGEWERDTASTRAYLAGVHDTLAYAYGAVVGEMCRQGANQNYIMKASQAMQSTGFQTKFLKSFRKKKQQPTFANVIALPVARS